MPSFRPLLLSLTILLTAAACTKATIDSPVVGNWRQVPYSGLTVPPPLNAGTRILVLRHDRTYEVKSGDVPTESGTYRIDSKTDPPLTTIWFSVGSYGSGVSFKSRDTLVLNYLGYTTGGPAVGSRYVRM